MIKHIVMWKFKEEVEKDEKFIEMQTIFSEMQTKITEINSLELYKGYQGYDACLITEHNNKQDLEIYQEHPAHKNVKKFMKEIVMHRASCDAEF